MKKRVLSISVFLAVILVFGVYVHGMSGRAEAETAANLERAIKRATIQCYAVEGRYPASVDYLVKNYGIQIDEDRFNVFYEGFASNIMPQITVTEEI